ncbi:MAG: hypothetical protein KTR30_00795 [Saprospiraceae bacterium]|nr:hypothetical protein [Saprospiraceae bacterium]
METLLSHGAKLELTDLNGETPLFEPIRSTIKDQDKRIQALQLLLKAGADRQHRNDKRKTPLDLVDRLREEIKMTFIDLLTTTK